MGLFLCLVAAVALVAGCQSLSSQQRANGRDAIEPRVVREAVGNYDVPPRLDSGNTPLYPPQLLQDRVVGKVSVTYTIGVDGQPRDIHVTEATDKEFGISISEAVAGWRFTPATKAGQPVSTSVKMVYRFCLSPPFDDCKAL